MSLRYLFTDIMSVGCWLRLNLFAQTQFKGCHEEFDLNGTVFGKIKFRLFF